MGRFAGTKSINRKAFNRALSRLEDEAQQSGRSLREQLLVSVDEFGKARHSEPDAVAAQLQGLPIEFFRELLNFGAGRAKRTPGQQIKKVLRPWSSDEYPKQLENWYEQIYGEFAKGALSEVMRDVLLFATKREYALIQRIRSAVVSGNVKPLEQIGRCVALIHGVRHEGTGPAARVACENKKLIGFSYLHLYELENKPPTATDIRIDLARDLCLRRRHTQRPKFSDIWYVLQSGSTDDNDEPGPTSRYEVVGTRYIKKVLKGLRWQTRPSPPSHLTAQAVMAILDRFGQRYVDDSATILDGGK
jgi:hypothetical protein